MSYLNTTAGALCAALIALTPTAVGQETQLNFEEDGKQVYMPGYFDRFAPQTARDMIRNLPGFQIREADQKRGLGQGGTNVLINGSRVSGKTNDPLDVLSRTSRDSVVRIEVVDGASLGISGLSGPVANVILDNSERSGNWEWSPQFRKGLKSRFTNASVSMSGKMGDVSYTVGLENNAFRSGAWGPEIVTGPNGELIETKYEAVENDGENPTLSLALGHTDAKNREANLNISAALFRFRGAFISDGTPADPSLSRHFDDFPRAEDEWNTEISADYAFDAFGGRTKLIAFQYLEDSDFENEAYFEDDTGFLGGQRFDRNIYEGETILRAEQTWSLGDRRSFELAGEGAYNFVETESSLLDIDSSNAETEITLPGSNTKIEENRYEISGTYNFPLGSKIDIQASLAGEYSELEQTGDTENSRNFSRPKGFLAATYKWSDNVEMRARVEREVGQLNFFAFASAVDLQNNNDRAGNSNLVPEQIWAYELALEKTFADNSQVTLSFEYEDIEDSVQRVPIELTDPDTGETFLTEGVGNVPEATNWRIRLQGTQMLERFGIKGGQLDYDIFARDSEIEDPFSGELRRLNGQQKWFYNFDFRHDIPGTDYAYGFFVEDFEQSEFFRGNEISLYSQSRPAIEIFAEHKDFYGLNAQVYVFNVLDFTEDFRRDRFDGLRPEGEFFAREQRVFDFDPIFGLNLSKTF